MRDAAIRIEPFFLEGAHGSLFCLYLAPADTTPQQGVLYLHPFAEEMHKSRRMAALQARALAHAGYAVLQVDLTGCGDSGGDFGDASWDVWRDDVRAAHAWLAERTPGEITLWGQRIGASLAVDVAPSLPRLSRLLLWQAVSNGEQFLAQFLRIKLANEMMSEGQAQNDTKKLRARLDGGEPVEVGGYLLSPGMARGLAQIKLADLHPPCPVAWLELGAQAGADIAPAGRATVERWRGAGIAVNTQVVAGEPFWVTQEITECADYVAATMQVMTP